MPASPTNCWTRAENALATALSNSAAFIALTGSANAAAALAKISGEELAWPADGEKFSEAERTARPVRAIVCSAEEQPYAVIRTESNRFEPSGTILIAIERLVDADAVEDAEIPLDLEREFKNFAGDVVDELWEYCEDYGPWLRGLRVESGPGWNPRVDWPSMGRLQGVSLLVEWGRNG
jgi:hypothetical protein